MGEWKVPELSESVSEKDGIITITISNLSATDSKELDIQLTEDKSYEVVEATIVTHEDMRAHNTFEETENVKETVFEAYSVEKNVIKTTLPACSVVEIRVK